MENTKLGVEVGALSMSEKYVNVGVDRSKNERPAKFKRNDDCIVNLIAVECSLCHNRFGIDPSFIDKFSEVSIIYTCPYCASEGKIK